MKQYREMILSSFLLFIIISSQKKKKRFFWSVFELLSFFLIIIHLYLIEIGFSDWIHFKQSQELNSEEEPAIVNLD